MRTLTPDELSTGSQRLAKPCSTASSLCIEKATSVAFMTSPLWNVIPLARSKVYTSPLDDSDHFVATLGITVPLGAWVTRLSYMLMFARNWV